ncbi:MAG: hypothetical protein ACK42G_07975 [Candidatus Kapaibacteriota bacterium]
MKKLTILTVLFALLTYSNIFSQDEKIEKDTAIETNKPYEIIIRPFGMYKFFNPKHYKHPSITIFSGFNNTNYRNIVPEPNFNTQNFASLHLGKTKLTTKEFENGQKLNEISRTGVFISNFSSKWQIQNNSNINAKMWRFGLDFDDGGFGYNLGSKNFLFFTHGASLIWSKFDVENLQNFPQPYSLRFSRFSEQFRFGTAYQSGISLLLFNTFSLDFRYERAIVFPGHKFWYWLGSSVVEVLAQGLLDEFIYEVAKSSPYAAPVVKGLLKGALSYGIYELRKDKMNWPFNTEPPLFNDNFKIGLTFIF